MKKVSCKITITPMHKPFPTSNCCGRTLVEAHKDGLRFSYCARCPHINGFSHTEETNNGSRGRIS